MPVIYAVFASHGARFLFGYAWRRRSINPARERRQPLDDWGWIVIYDVVNSGLCCQ